MFLKSFGQYEIDGQDQVSPKWIEELSMKRIDGQSAKRYGNATEINNILYDFFFTGSTFDLFQWHFHV